MPSRRQFLSALAVVLVVTILYWFAIGRSQTGLHQSVNTATVEASGPMEKEGSATSLPAPSPNPILNSPDQTQTVLLSESTKNLMLNCARGSETFSGVGKTSEFATLDQYLTQSPVAHGGAEASQELLLENLQLSTPNHEKIRVRFSPQNRTENQASKIELKTEVFGVDSDDLPVLIRFPDELAGLNQAETISRLKAKFSTLDFDEKTVAFRWLNGASATVSYRNNQIDQMQIYFENRGSMGCALTGEQIDCSCLKAANQ